MNIYHKIEIRNKQNITVLYVNYPDSYEFGLDFDSVKSKIFDLTNKISTYVKKLSENISDDSVLVVLNGVVIGTLFISQLVNPLSLENNENTNISNNIESLQTDNLNTGITSMPEKEKSSNDNATTKNTQNSSNITSSEENLKEIIAENEKDDSRSNVSNNTTKEITNNENNSSNSTKENQSNNKVNVTSKPEQKPTNNNTQHTTSSPNNNANNGNSSNSVSKPTSPSTPSKPTVNTEIKVNLKLNNGNIISIDLEEYIIGVVGAEMPASFNIEALKAQAVAARTYAMDKVSMSQTLTATTSSQCYKTNEELKKMWGNEFSMYYSKVQNAVNATKGMVIKHNGKYIDAVYFSMSNGRTEDAINVWGNSFSYLKSVESSYDANLPKTTQTTTISKSTFNQKLGTNISTLSEITILEKTIGNRVALITIGGKNFTGVYVRGKLGLRSSDFTISESGDNFIFTTKGYGHGVGMSQYGANEMGKLGFTYKQILTHYYTGVAITKI